MRALIWVVAVPVLLCSAGKSSCTQQQRWTPIAEAGDIRAVSVCDPRETFALYAHRNGCSGEATFTVPQRTPEHVNVRVSLSSEHWHCACWALADTQKIFKNGITQSAVIKESKALHTLRATAKPGEIVFLVRAFSFFERLLYGS